MNDFLSAGYHQLNLNTAFLQLFQKKRLVLQFTINLRVLKHRNNVNNNIIAGLFTVLFLAALPVFSQEEKLAPNPGGYWLAYTGDNKINSRIGIHSEVQLRNLFLERTVESFLVRTGLNVYIKPYAMATAGYGYFYGAPSNPEIIGAKTSEHRIWQQLILRQKSKNIFIEHRYRLEQRFLQNLSTGTNRQDHRLRYRFQTLFPLYSISPHLRHFFVGVNNEIMINFRNDPSRLFDRNRFFSGIGYQVSPKMNFQLGYLNQFSQITGNPKAQVDHILQFGVSYNMDDLMQTFFRKKQEI